MSGAALLVTLLGVVAAARVISARNDLVRARALLLQGNAALLRGTSGPANRYYAEAERALASARSKTGFPASLFRPLPLAGSPIRAIDDADGAGDDIVRGSRILARAVAGFPIHGTSDIRGDHLQPFHDAARRAELALAEARPYFVAAQAALRGPAGAFLPWVSTPAESMRGVVATGIARVDRAGRAFDVVQQLTAPHAEYRMLFVSLDTLEARPGGGYVGSFGVLHFHGATVHLEHYQSFESLRTASPPIAAPAALADATTQPFGIENSMWWPSFPASARVAAELYERQGGGHVDGVVGFTNDELGALVGAVGPLPVPGYSPVSGRGFEQRVLYETALKRPLDTPRKRFLTETSRALFDRLVHLRSALVPDVVDVIERGVGRGDISLWFADRRLEGRIADTAVAGALPQPHGDAVEISEANVSGSKANQSLVRDVRYEVHRSEDGTYRARLDIEYHDNAGPNPYLNPYYNGYVRIYVPHTAVLDEARSDDFNDVGLAPDAPYRVFAGYVFVQPNGRQRLVIEWTLPRSIAPSGHYQLAWVRQTGTTADDVTVRVGDHTVTVPADQRVTHVAFDVSPNPVAHWLHERWVFRQLGF